MSIPVACPKCGTVLKAPDGSAGRKARCKKCQERFRVPGTPTTNDDDMPIVVDESLMLSSFDFSNPDVKRDKPSQYGRPQGRGALKIAIGLGVVFVLLIGGAVAAWVWRDRADAQAKTQDDIDKINRQRQAEERQLQQKNEQAQRQAKRDEAKAAVKEKGIDPTASLPKELRMTGAALPAPPGKDAKPIGPKPNAVVLPYELKTLDNVIVNSSRSRVAVSRVSFAGFQGQGAIRTVDCFTFPAAQKLASIEVPSDVKDGLLALGTGDGWLAAETLPGKLSLWNTSNGKKLVGDMTVIDVPKDENVKTLSAALSGLFVGDGIVWAVTKNGTIRSVKMDGETAQSKVAVEAPKRLGTTFSCTPGVNFALSGDGKTAVYGVESDVVAASLSSGLSKVEWTTPVKAVRWLAMEPDDGGNRVACVVADATGAMRVCAGRLGTPKAIVNTAYPSGAGGPRSIVWLGESFAVRTDRGEHLIYDTETAKFVGVVLTGPPSPVRMTLPGGDRLQIVDAGKDKQFTLIDIEFPFEGYFPLRDQAADNQKPWAFLLNGQGFLK